MKIGTLIGGILSSAAIIGMVEIYTTHAARASVEPEPEIDYNLTLPTPLPTLYDLVADRDFECLAHNVYFEARGESALGQRAVAWVTLNRMFSEQFPDTICEVVKQAVVDSNGNPRRHQCQFSWYCDGKADVPQDQEAFAQAQAMAQEVLENYFDRPDPTEGSLYFHADFVNPSWRRSFNRVVQIDKHIFYNLDQG